MKSKVTLEGVGEGEVGTALEIMKWWGSRSKERTPFKMS
jgi:hypothetical protein